MEVKGRDLSAGLPKTLTIRSEEIREALHEPLSATPPKAAPGSHSR